MIILTGGAGFIGSCVLRKLNDRGIDDVVVVDNIASTDKWMNLRNKKYREYVNKKDFLSYLDKCERAELIIHLGACSSTTERDFDYLWDNNVSFSKLIWEYCVSNGTDLIYASSAATYGDGSNGFDDKEDISRLSPLNGYGYSKQIFDVWVEKQKERPVRYAGLKFYNVYGPNEYCKGSMASMVYHGFRQIKKDDEIRLFKSMNPDYKDGLQLRDFIYVKDVCNVIMWLMDHKEVSGIFNVGTGRAQSFKELAEAVFKALDLKPNIRYIDMPENLREKYQYFTEADMEKLRSAGYKDGFLDVEHGVDDYVRNYLDKGFLIY